MMAIVHKDRGLYPMRDISFKPMHINASKDDLAGNNGIGRYIFLPGSDGRAKEISKYFSNVTVKPHSRGHHLYLGTLPTPQGEMEVATVASGMGCPSMEIVLHELFHLGGKRFLRVGTSGSLQPGFVKMGDLVNATASVRDESTTQNYMPIEIPALASFEILSAVLQAAKIVGVDEKLHTGIVHCKSSFYAREFGDGPQGNINRQYMRQLAKFNVLASEMETAALFTQAQIYHRQLIERGRGPAHQVLAGAILGIVTVEAEQATHDQHVQIENELIQLAIATFKNVAQQDARRVQ